MSIRGNSNTVTVSLLSAGLALTYIPGNALAHINSEVSTAAAGAFVSKLSEIQGAINTGRLTYGNSRLPPNSTDGSHAVQVAAECPDQSNGFDNSCREHDGFAQ